MEWVNIFDCSPHDRLVVTYISTKFSYSQSFKNRVCMDIGIIHYTRCNYSKEMAQLSDKELKERMSKLKKPWWYDFYEKKLFRHNKRLWLIFLLFLRRDYSWYGLKQIYKAIKTNKKEFGD